MFVDMDSIEYGVDDESLTTAMQRWAGEQRHVYFNNVSRAENFIDAPRQYWYNYVRGGRGVVLRKRLPVVDLVLGTAMHKAAEKLLTMKQNGIPCTAPDAIRAAQRIALDTARDGLQISDNIVAKIYDEWLAFESYSRDLIAAAAPKLAIVDRVLAAEQPVWACAPVYEAAGGGLICWVCLIGTPDAVILLDDHVWHLQHKTRGREMGVDTLVTKLSFSGHETVYGQILGTTLRRGDWGQELSDVPYGGSKIAVWLKKGRPPLVPEAIQKGLIEFIERAKIAVRSLPDGYIGVEKTGPITDKQWAGVNELVQRWNERERARRAELAGYEEVAMQIHDCDLDADKIALGFRRMIYASVWQWQSAGMDDEVGCNTNACERWGRPCAFLESAACAGWDPIDPFDPDGQWISRDPDYVDILRAEYAMMQEEEVGLD